MTNLDHVIDRSVHDSKTLLIEDGENNIDLPFCHDGSCRLHVMNRCTTGSDQPVLFTFQQKLKNSSAFHQLPGAFNEMKLIEIDVIPIKISQRVFKILPSEV